MHGTVTSDPEVTNISAHGFWFFLDGEELALSFADFPWFRKASVEQLVDMQRPSADHLCWPRLDIDLSIASIRNPAAFPLISAA
jgi:hypothetical protein